MSFRIYYEPYIKALHVHRFRYTRALKDAFLGSDLAQLQNLDARGWLAGIDANVFVANHDTERGGDSLRWDSPANSYTLAMVFSL